MNFANDIYDRQSYIEWASESGDHLKSYCIREVAIRAVLRSLPFMRRHGRSDSKSNSAAILLTIKHMFWARSSIFEQMEKIPDSVEYSVAATTHGAATRLCESDWVTATTVANYSFNALRERLPERDACDLAPAT